MTGHAQAYIQQRACHGPITTDPLKQIWRGRGGGGLHNKRTRVLVISFRGKEFKAVLVPLKGFSIERSAARALMVHFIILSQKTNLTRYNLLF